MQWTIFGTSRYRARNPIPRSSLTLWVKILRDQVKTLITISLRNSILGKGTFGPVSLSIIWRLLGKKKDSR